jgi:putative phosphoribosyl transferase
MAVRFADRTDAGRQLAAALLAYANRPDVVVLGLPRGGVPIAAEVARALTVPFDVFLVRKLGVPGHDELAMGAIAAGGVEILNQDVIHALRISPALVERVAARERAELQRRDAVFRGGQPLTDVRGLTVILVDDGLATGSTMQAAIAALRGMDPAKIVAAAPVGAVETCARLRGLADDVVCLSTPPRFEAVGQWYDDFTQTTDEEVRRLLSAR